MRDRTARYIVRFNCALSTVIWLPAWLKMWHTGSADDYSLPSLLMIFWLQASNLLVAVLDRTKNLTIYLIVNTVTVGFTVGLIWWLQH